MIISMALVVLLASGSTLTASAKAVDLGGYKYYKSYKCTTYMQGTITSNWNSVTFSGKSGGEYKGTVQPNAITHNDIIKTVGIGSISVSCNGTTTSGNATVNGNTWTESYPVKNSKSVTVYPTYTGESSLITFTVTFSASTKYEFGSTFVVVKTGDATVTE